jgi:hypothetical protein
MNSTGTPFRVRGDYGGLMEQRGEIRTLTIRNAQPTELCARCRPRRRVTTVVYDSGCDSRHSTEFFRIELPFSDLSRSILI